MEISEISATAWKKTMIGTAASAGVTTALTITLAALIFTQVLPCDAIGGTLALTGPIVVDLALVAGSMTALVLMRQRREQDKVEDKAHRLEISEEYEEFAISGRRRVNGPVEREGGYDVTILGAGPVGLATAITLALQGKDQGRKIVVLERRESGTGREHALFIAKDGIQAIRKALRPNQLEGDVEAKAHARQVRSYLKEWVGRSISTNKIQKKLIKRAAALGVTIIRDTNYDPILKQEHLKNLCGNECPVIEGAQKNSVHEVHNILSKTKVLLGCDGRHSQVRRAFLGQDTEALESNNEGYIIEVKYNTPNKTKKRSYLEAFIDATYQLIAFETMPREKPGEAKKRGAIHFLCDKETYDAFPQPYRKSLPTQTWNYRQLTQEAEKNPQIKDMKQKIDHYFDTIVKRGGQHLKAGESQETIKRLPLNIYQSKSAVVPLNTQNPDLPRVAIAGDAFSGKILLRGVNAGFQEAAALATRVDQYLRDPDGQLDAFDRYNQEVLQISAKERRWAHLRAGFLNFGNRTLMPVRNTKLSFGRAKEYFTPMSKTFKESFDFSSSAEDLEEIFS